MDRAVTGTRLPEDHPLIRLIHELEREAIRLSTQRQPRPVPDDTWIKASVARAREAERQRVWWRRLLRALGRKP